jgi:hypothetical protein
MPAVSLQLIIYTRSYLQAILGSARQQNEWREVEVAQCWDANSRHRCKLSSGATVTVDLAGRLVISAR